MKKIIKLFSVIFPALIMMFTLISCESHSSDTENNKEEVGIISFDGAEIKDNYIYLFENHDVNYVSLSELITVSSNAIWNLYYDKLGQIEIPTKIAASTDGILNDGENMFYIVVKTPDNSVSKLYELNVYRSFEVSIKYMHDEKILKTEYAYSGFEYEIVFEPYVEGYVFNGWSYNNQIVNTITLDGDIVLNGIFISNKNTTYKVEHYQENINDDDYSLHETNVLYGETGTFTNAKVNKYTGFTPQKFQQEIIRGDGSTVVKLYYVRNKNNVTIKKNIENAGEVTIIDEKYKFGENVSIETSTNLGYSFIGWYVDEIEVSKELSFSFSMPNDNVEYEARWAINDEMKNYNFKSTSTTCEITGIIDKNESTIIVPNYVTNINQSAFFGCSLVESITIPFVGESVTTNTHFGYIFGASSYSYNNSKVPSSLKEVVIVEGCTSIDKYAFSGCSNLTNIIIPNSVISIGAYAFSGCSSLQSITIPFVGGSVTTNTYFGYIFGAGSYSSNQSYIPSSLKEVVIVEGCTSIDKYAFSGCSSLASIIIPSSVTSIGKESFSNCSSLVSITIPDSVTSIGSSVFSGCRCLANITIPTSVTSIGSSVFLGCRNLTSIIIPSSVTSIGKESFSQCIKLTNITIPTSVTSISSSTFSGCSSLANITIPDSVTSIGSNAFSGCSSLANITIPSSVTSIGSNAFSECSSLVNVSIPSTITNLEEGVFSGCSSLANITIPDSVTSIGKESFSKCNKLTSITIPNSVTSIGEAAFFSCGLTSIIIPSSVISIETSSFAFCGRLGSITIPDSVTSIGSSAFSYCSILKSITIPNSVTSIGEQSFYNCSSLANITIPSSVTSIGKQSFYNCSSLASITIPNSVTSIGSSAFSGCSSLESITIPSSVTSIGSSIFSECSSLESITIPSSVTSIGSSAFSGCSSLQSITIPFVGESVTTNTHFGYIFGASSYSSNNSKVPPSLKEVVILEECTSIDKYAFYGCDNLTNIMIPNSVQRIGISAFSGCSSLASITIPSSLISLGTSAFSECSNLSKIYYFGETDSLILNRIRNIIKNAKIYYYSVIEPTIEGDYWHLVNGKIVEW